MTGNELTRGSKEGRKFRQDVSTHGLSWRVIESHALDMLLCTSSLEVSEADWTPKGPHDSTSSIVICTFSSHVCFEHFRTYSSLRTLFRNFDSCDLRSPLHRIGNNDNLKTAQLSPCVVSIYFLIENENHRVNKFPEKRDT